MLVQDLLTPYLLGLDIGSHSVGWALIALDEQGRPCGIIDCGVRTFAAGVDATYNQMIEGKQMSRAANRREKRGPRRQHWRRAWRRYRVLKCLVSHGLLRDPDGPNPDDYDLRKPRDQDRFLKEVDSVLRERLLPVKNDPRRHLCQQVWLYELRAQALERRLDPLELGRALYHLAQRRGFLSNRKTDSDEDQEKTAKAIRKNKAKAIAMANDGDGEGGRVSGAKEDTKKVKEAIAQLDRDMERAISDPMLRTYGYYFARCINPEEHRIRGTGRGTDRKRYEYEFKAIWDAQRRFYAAGTADSDTPPYMTEDFRLKISRRDEPGSIFFQRPLKPTAHLVGHCELEEKFRKALQALPIAQRFRMIQKVNDLEIIEPDGSSRRLNEDERRELIEALSTRGDLTFSQIRDEVFVNLQKPRRRKDKETGKMVVVDPGHTFNLDRPPIEKMPGDRSASRILKCDEKAPGIAQCWADMRPSQREELILALLDWQDPDTLTRHLTSRFGFTPKQAAVLKGVKPESARCAFSVRAIERLLQYMERPDDNGRYLRLNEAIEQIEEYRVKARHRKQIYDFLPRVIASDRSKYLADAPFFKRRTDLRNPAITRALAETRKVVNAIIRRSGRKPAYIHVELGRELKKSAKARGKISSDIKKNTGERQRAVKAMQEEIGFTNPSERDKTRWLLGMEQAWHCPYCGQPMERRLFLSGAFHEDHIIPRHISFENGPANMVLCHAECNEKKGMNIPTQAFSIDELGLTTKRLPTYKRQRILWTEEDVKERYQDEDGGFTKRQLHVMQGASGLAAEYMGLLYGGVIDENGERRVQVSSGAVTSILRSEWDLDRVLPGLRDFPKLPPELLRLDKKLRSDHRHHAIDAMVIALTNVKTVKRLSDAAAKVDHARLQREEVRDSEGRRRTRFAPIKPPWGEKWAFVDEVRDAIAKVTVSRRPERGIAGPLHAETNYSRRIEASNGYRRRKRIPITALSVKQIEDENVIPEKAVREAIRAKWKELGCGDPKDVFADAKNHPRMRAREGRTAPFIHTVRVNVTDKPIPIGHGCRQRFVVSGKDTLHHLLILEVTDRKGRKIWRARSVSRLRVHRRLARLRRRARRGGGSDEGSLIRTEWRHGPTFVMWVCKGDFIEMDTGNGDRAIYLVKAISVKQSIDIKVRLHNDARVDMQINQVGERGQFRIRSGEELRMRNARKVVITPLGDEDKKRHGINAGARY